MADVLEEVTAAIDRLVATDVGVLADSEALVALHAQVERLTAALTRAAGRFDADGSWAADGARSAAAWISARCRMPMPAARRRSSLARALRSMPETESAWLAGRIAEAQVTVLRGARDTSQTSFCRDEPALVAKAVSLQHRHLVREVAYWRQQAAPDDAEREAADDHEARRAHLSPGMHGTGFLDVLFDPYGYAIFEQTLTLIEQELFAADWTDARSRLGDTLSVRDLRRTPAQRRHDALVEMARRARALPAGARLPEPLFTLHLGTDSARRMCQLATGTVVTPGSAIRWLDDAWIERIASGLPDRPVNVSVRRRLFTGATRRAVQARHTECYHELCDIPAERCQIDHIQPYATGGPTIDTNGRPACGFHNRLRNRLPEPDPDDEPP